MLSAVFEPQIPEIKRPQTYAVDSTAIGVSETSMLRRCLVLIAYENYVLLLLKQNEQVSVSPLDHY